MCQNYLKNSFIKHTHEKHQEKKTPISENLKTKHPKKTPISKILGKNHQKKNKF